MPSISSTKQVSANDELSEHLTEPRLFNVVIFNDNVTTMEFVITLLLGRFKHTRNCAEKLTLHIHNHGSAVAGTYPYDIAETKVIETIANARKAGFPLICTSQASSL